MENIYLIIVIVLFALAVSDLIVGVSNDAVNFLNSAFGSKAAPKWLIFLMAGLGIMIGATFSGGMMEVARKGIFHPDMFVFSEVMVIFLAVMITDIILLDIFNSFGLPTSTTVSIVFELLGSAVAVSLLKIKKLGQPIEELAIYINSEKALAIITGIIISVGIAFTTGAIIQYITRLIFTFNYRKNMKYFGSLFGGLAITAITYFILIKGIEGSVFAEIEVASGEKLGKWVIMNTGKLLIYSFIALTAVLQILKWLFNIKILKLTVLTGTFALALAFAGNDMINFIGVPIAGLQSFKAWTAAGIPSAGSFNMKILMEDHEASTLILFISGLIMVGTLIFSKKAQLVVNTSVDLARQNEGAERFNSTFVARTIVRGSTTFGKIINKIIPEKVKQKAELRFRQEKSRITASDAPAFDKIRASVNLLVASILIAVGTSYKLPLSTTYVTFMVAMGTSLADRAWDRDSAVYRISGVFSVIGGWFLTAIVAFTTAALVAWIISIGGLIMIFVFLTVIIVVVIRTHILFKKRNKIAMAEEDDAITEKDETEKVLEKWKKQILKTLLRAQKIYNDTISGFLEEDRSVLKEIMNLKENLNRKTKKQKNKVFETISKIEENVDSGHFYVQATDHQREMANSLNFFAEPLFEHVDNNHKPFTKQQTEELKSLKEEINKFFDSFITLVKDDNYSLIGNLTNMRNDILIKIENMEVAQIKRIKALEVNTRNSVLFFNTISETKNMLLHTISLLKAHRNFMMVSKETGKPKHHKKTDN